MFKRKVFYIGGFDPRGARFYHELLAQQIATHNAGQGSGNPLSLSPRRSDAHGDRAWQVSDAAATVQTAFHFLAWDDIVRRAWIRSTPRLLSATVRAYARLLRHADLSCLARVPHGSRVALFLPALALLIVPLLAGLGAGAIALWLGRPWLAPLLALVVAALLALLLGGRGHVGWIVQFLVFNDALAAGQADPALSPARSFCRNDRRRPARRGGMGRSAAGQPFQRRDPGGGSDGAAARATRRCTAAAPGAGHAGASLPMLGARRDAHGFAQTMATLAQGRFAWLDIGSPTDGAATPLVDPWLGQPPPGWPGWSSFRRAGSRSAIRPPMPRGARTSISPISIICAGSIGHHRSITWA
jgi:hypothetical protein